MPVAQPLDDSIELFKALADPVRLRLLNLLAGGEICVCHLYEALGLPQSTVSRHLTYLRQRGLVLGRKDELWVLRNPPAHCTATCWVALARAERS